MSDQIENRKIILANLLEEYGFNCETFDYRGNHKYIKSKLILIENDKAEKMIVLDIVIMSVGENSIWMSDIDYIKINIYDFPVLEMFLKYLDKILNCIIQSLQDNKRTTLFMSIEKSTNNLIFREGETSFTKFRLDFID